MISVFRRVEAAEREEQVVVTVWPAKSSKCLASLDCLDMSYLFLNGSKSSSANGVFAVSMLFNAACGSFADCPISN